MKFPLCIVKKSLVPHLTLLFACVLTLSSFISAQKSSAEIVMAPEATTLMQCANGGRGTPEIPCDGLAAWQFGNLGRNNSQWVEGEFVPYRVLITDLTPGSTGNTITIFYQTTENGKHAIDY